MANLFSCMTSGTGLWSRAQKPVAVCGLAITFYNAESGYGSLDVYFDARSWKTEVDGLIYTDDRFVEALCVQLKNFFNFTDRALETVEYSEQGMQGDDYVNLDVGRLFIEEWQAKNYPELVWKA